MTTPTASATRPQPDLYLDTPHQHTRSCFWDYLECRWQCPPATATNRHGPTQDATAATDTDCTRQWMG